MVPSASRCRSIPLQQGGSSGRHAVTGRVSPIAITRVPLPGFVLVCWISNAGSPSINHIQEPKGEKEVKDDVYVVCLVLAAAVSLLVDFLFSKYNLP
jgi:hypothetical protein